MPLVVGHTQRHPRVSDLQKAELAWLAANAELPERVVPKAPRARPLHPHHLRTTHLPQHRQIPATRLVQPQPAANINTINGLPQVSVPYTYVSNYWPPYGYGEPYPNQYAQYGQWYIPQLPMYAMNIKPEQGMLLFLYI